MSILSHPDESAEEFCPLKVVDYFAVANHEAHWTVVFMKVATIDPSHHLGMGQCVCEGRISWRGTVNDTKSVVFVIEAERRDTGGLVPVYTAGFDDLHSRDGLSKARCGNNTPLRPRRENRGEQSNLGAQESPPSATSKHFCHAGAYIRTSGRLEYLDFQCYSSFAELKRVRTLKSSSVVVSPVI